MMVRPLTTAMVTTVEMVSPEQAAKWLGDNYVQNRKLSKSKVRVYVDRINRGEWKLTHQGVAFYPDGTLVDGQHRLGAIVQTGVTLPMNVTYNLPFGSYDSIDIGFLRGAGQTVGLTRPSSTVIPFITRIALGSATAQSPAVLRVFARQWVPIVEKLHSHAPGHVKVFASGPVLAAAAVRSAKHGEDYPMRVYRALVNKKFSDMPPFVEAFYDQVRGGEKLDRSAGVRKMDQNELLIRAWTAFDPSKADLTLLKVYENMRVKTLQAIRKELLQHTDLSDLGVRA